MTVAEIETRLDTFARRILNAPTERDGWRMIRKAVAEFAEQSGWSESLTRCAITTRLREGQRYA